MGGALLDHIDSYRIEPRGRAWAWHILSGNGVIAAGETADVGSARAAVFLWVIRHADDQSGDATRH